MDDLLIHLRALLVGDPVLLSVFVSCGKDVVEVVDPMGRAEASYPRIILDGDDGSQMNFADNAAPKFFDGEVRIEIVTRRDDDYCPDHLATLRAIQSRCVALLLGNEIAGIESLKGTRFVGDSGEAWCLTQWRQGSGRFLTVTDPKYKRHLTKFPVQLCKTRIPGG